MSDESKSMKCVVEEANQTLDTMNAKLDEIDKYNDSLRETIRVSKDRLNRVEVEKVILLKTVSALRKFIEHIKELG